MLALVRLELDLLRPHHEPCRAKHAKDQHQDRDERLQQRETALSTQCAGRASAVPMVGMRRRLNTCWPWSCASRGMPIASIERQRFSVLLPPLSASTMASKAVPVRPSRP